MRTVIIQNITEVYSIAPCLLVESIAQVFLTADGIIYNDFSEVCNLFNSYFTNIAFLFRTISWTFNNYLNPWLNLSYLLFL